MPYHKQSLHLIKVTLLIGLLFTASAFANLDARDTETDCKFSLIKITSETLNAWLQQRNQGTQNQSITFQAINQCTGKTETLTLVGKGVEELSNGELQLEALYSKPNQSQALRRLKILTNP
ncbi:MAG: hypothetical protein K2X66_00685 [Cyanobacteria bacterium]|nr:hypothetical protein [Cyanobacteriota bacterium]